MRVELAVHAEDLHSEYVHFLQDLGAYQLRYGGFLVGYEALALHPGDVVGDEPCRFYVRRSLGEPEPHERVLGERASIPSVLFAEGDQVLHEA